MGTKTEYIDSIVDYAERLTRYDCDTTEFADTVKQATQHLLTERVEVVPGEDDGTSKHVKNVLCEWYLGFYMMVLNPELGGSLIDYCAYHVIDALYGYVVASYDDPKAMLDDIEPAVGRALSPEHLYSELASIGIE